MKYKIYRNNDVIATVRANGNLTEKIFSEETLTMDFSLNRFILFKVGDRVSVYGKNYYIVEEPSVEKISTRQYRYNLTFNGVKYRLSEVKYFFYDHENRLSVPEFSITGTATKMLELVVANTNRAGQLGWRIGKVSTTETKTIDFSNSNCLAALARIAEEFDIELWIDADKSIHLENRTQSSGYRLEYGKSKGIKSISRNPYTEASLVTRLYAQGGTKNLPANYRNGQKRLRMPVPYLEKNTAFYGVVEHVQNFDEIYPKRVGVVTKIFDNEPRMFADETLDFDLNEHNQYGSKYLIAGTSAKVIFQTGDLAGYVLEVQKGGFNSQTKAFTLLKNKEEKAFEIPSAQFKPRVGDKYILVDIMMPEAYVLEAERELQAAAQKYLDKNSKQRFVYGIVPDPLYLKKINFSLKLGNTIRFKDEDFGLDADIRVVSITRDINNPYLTAFEIAEQPTITQLVRNYIEKERRDNIIIAEQRKNEQRISEAYETMQEIQNNTFDADGYFKPEKIKPLSIETKMLSVGAPLQQFDLFDVIIFQSSANEVKNTAGTLVHYTIADSPKTWNIAQGSHTLKANEASYIYAKCERNGNRGTILCTSKKIAALSDGNYYHFELGYISTLKDKEVRKIKLISGFTAINGGEIITGRITSQDGNNWIDIKQDKIEINAKVQFAGDSPAFGQVKNYVDQALTNISIAKGNIDKSILDGVVTEAETKAIEVSLENLKTEYTQNSNRATKILEQLRDAELVNAKAAYDSSFNSLNSYILSAISDKKITDGEKQSIKSKFEEYRLKAKALFIAMEKVNGVRISEVARNVQAAKTLSESLSRQVRDVSSNVRDIENKMINSVIPNAEAQSLFMSLENLKANYEERLSQVRRVVGGNSAGNYYSAFDIMVDLFGIFDGHFSKAKNDRKITAEAKNEAIRALEEYIVMLDALRNIKVKVYPQSEEGRITRDFMTYTNEITGIKNTLNSYLNDLQISAEEINDFNNKISRLNALHTAFKSDVTAKTQDDSIVRDLKPVYEEFKLSFKLLYDNIIKVISSGKITEQARQEIRDKFNSYREKISNLADAVETLNWNARERTEIAYSRTERLQKVTDFLSTTIDGDVISTGVLQVGGLDASGESKSNAGISGTTEKGEGNDVRFWAGSTAENKDNAPFRVK
ncbi:hypothetical protein, partial [Ornithobacterium rhinotracheale]